MDSEYDIVIVGGGMVGASLALCLSQQLSAQTRIMLVESFPFPEQNEQWQKNYSPSFDARSTALSYSSRIIYEHLGLWSILAARLCPINAIHVSDRGHIGSAALHAQDTAWDALGYVVENAWLGQILIRQLQIEHRIELVSPATVSAVTPVAGAIKINVLENEQPYQLTAKLLVVADGANSSLRQKLGIATNCRDYKQQALIANVGLQQHHDHWAFERFTDTGPMAMLPLLDGADGEHRSALVWTLPAQRAEYLQACEDAEFLMALQQRFGSRLGAITHVGERFCYPLKLVEAKEQVRSNIVIMGNAAHSLHPVAGQGFNLALRDVAHLSACLSAAQKQGRAIGDLEVLLNYEQQQKLDQKITIGFSDKITELFANQNPLVSLARNMGLLAMDLVPELKDSFVSHAAGQAGLADWPYKELTQ